MRTGNPIRIGETLREALMSSEAVTKIIGNRIYPYTTREEINAPHAVYDGVSVTYADTKEGSYAESVSATIHANASDYSLSIAMASAIVDVLLEKDAHVDAVNCDYNDAANMYVHNISITIQL